MKKPYGIIVFALLFLCLLVASVQGVAQADGHAAGEKIFATSCASCHTPQKRSLAGKGEEYLLKRFNNYEQGDYTSGAAKKMKDLFIKMSDAEKMSLAKYAHGMK